MRLSVSNPVNEHQSHADSDLTCYQNATTRFLKRDSEASFDSEFRYLSRLRARMAGAPSLAIAS